MIRNYIKTLLRGKVGKSEVLAELLENAESSISTIIIPTIRELLNRDTLIELQESKDVERFVKEFSKLTTNRKISNIRDMLEAMLEYNNEALDNIGLLYNNVSEMSKYISDEDMTVRDYAVASTVNEYMNTTLYSIDLLLYLVYLINGIDNANSFMTQGKVDMIGKGISEYGILVKRTLDQGMKERLQGLDKLSDNIPDVENGGVTMTENDKAYKLPKSDFLYSTIYNVRVFFLNRDLDKIRVLKDKKKLLESKVLELKLGTDTDVKGSIEAYEEIISKTESKIKKLSEV